MTLACVEDSQEASDGYLSAEPATPGPAAPEQTPPASSVPPVCPPVCPPAVNPDVQPSRNPLDDPELARYLLPTSQELTEQLLCITPSATHTPGPSRPMALAGYAALLAEMKEGI